MALATDTRILKGKYRIIKLLGEGGVARVWLAEEPKFANRKVAIKELKTERLTPAEIEEQQRYFRQELEIAAELEKVHAPNVIRGLTVETLEDGTELLVMEFAAGGALDKIISEQRQGLPIKQAIAIALDICQALQVFHGLPSSPVHRDIKPSNILFDAEGRAYLSDFGLAQLPNRSRGRSVVTAGPHPGTPKYMSPEQESEVGSLFASSDIFSLGCVLFEMVTGQPYKKVRPGTVASSLRPELPAWLTDLLAAMLQPDRYSRVDDTEVVAQALRTRTGPVWDRRPIGKREAAPLDLNRAGVEELALLPGIRPTLAQKIVLLREEQGYLDSMSDLSGIGGLESTVLVDLQPLVSVGPPSMEQQSRRAQILADRLAAAERARADAEARERQRQAEVEERERRRRQGEGENQRRQRTAQRREFFDKVREKLARMMERVSRAHYIEVGVYGYQRIGLILAALALGGAALVLARSGAVQHRLPAMVANGVEVWRSNSTLRLSFYVVAAGAYCYALLYAYAVNRLLFGLLCLPVLYLLVAAGERLARAAVAAGQHFVNWFSAFTGFPPWLVVAIIVAALFFAIVDGASKR